MKILFLGAGATGGYFGGRMAAAGVDASFLVRPRRAALLGEGPLRIESPMGDVNVPVTAITADALAADGGRAYDLVVLSCKAYDLDDAIASIGPAVGAQTFILPLLNGMAHLDRLDAAFGAERILGGLCQIAATLTPDGTIRHLNQTHLLVFGGRRPEQEPFCACLARAIAPAAFEMRHSDDIVLEMWEKWVMLASLAAATCLMRATIGDIVAAPHGQAIVTETLSESAEIAAAAGFPPREDTLTRIRGLLTEPGSTFAASMLRDVEAGNPVEADHIEGDLIARAEAAGVFTPRLCTAYCHLKAYENRRDRERAQA
ncbi:MAG: 2-dehydropantoate 2-reductase [Rhodospirillales bacterium]|nr:2-dehydropantoate 2-reductase [Rhodospirillales bacterium]